MRRVPSSRTIALSGPGGLFLLVLSLLAAPLVLFDPVLGQGNTTSSEEDQDDAADGNRTRVAGAPWPFDSGTMWKGDVYTVRMNETGTFRYGCVPHPQMRALVEVHADAPEVEDGVLHLASRDLHFGTWDGTDPKTYQVGTRVAVPPGTQVEWTNLDRITHTVTSDINWAFEEGTLPAVGFAWLALAGAVVAGVFVARR